EANERTADLQAQLAALKKGQAEAEESQGALSQFLKEFPHVARDLFSGRTERQLPGAMLRAIQRSLDPTHAMVLVRRAQEAEGVGLVVAAAFPESAVPRVGTEIAGDQGELGFVVESQLVTSRAELVTPQVRERIRAGGESLSAFQPELYAPLVFDQD